MARVEAASRGAPDPAVAARRLQAEAAARSPSPDSGSDCSASAVTASMRRGSSRGTYSSGSNYTPARLAHLNQRTRRHKERLGETWTETHPMVLQTEQELGTAADAVRLRPEELRRLAESLELTLMLSPNLG